MESSFSIIPSFIYPINDIENMFPDMELLRDTTIPSWFPIVF